MVDLLEISRNLLHRLRLVFYCFSWLSGKVVLSIYLGGLFVIGFFVSVLCIVLVEHIFSYV